MPHELSGHEHTADCDPADCDVAEYTTMSDKVNRCICHSKLLTECPTFLARTRIREYGGENGGVEDAAPPPTKKTANARQVGGAHYGLNDVQHWDLVVLFGWDYFQGQIIKYVMRHKKKHGLEDLKKASHFLEKYIEEIEAGRITL